MPESEEKARPSHVSRARRLLRYDSITRASESERDQIYVLKAYSAVGFLVLAIFGLLHILVEGNDLVGWLELVFSGVILLNVVGFRFAHNLPAARLFFLISIMAVLLGLVVTGGTRDTGIFWLFVFPNLAFFLAGKRQGLWWMASLGIAVGTIVLLSELSLMHIPYSLITMRQLLISLAIVAFGVYLYQSARERALQEAHDSRRDLQKYLDHMTTFSVKISLSGSIILANEAAKEASGIGERLIGTSFLESPWWSFDASVQRRVEAAFYKVLTGQTVNYDEKLKAVSTSGSAVLTVNFSMIPIFDKNQRISYILAEARDISTEQAVDHAKSEFVGVASRQLHGPIVSATRLSSKLLTGDIRRLNEQQRADIRELYRNSQHMTAIISDMLLVSQLELTSLPVKPIPGSISKISQTIVRDIRSGQLKNRRLEIEEEYPEHVPDVPVDSEIMRIVLRNLITNAVTYTPDTGRVYVRIRRIDEKLQSESQGSVQIEVQDNGYGIPRTEQKKLFTKFFRASNNTAKSPEGMGLGLHIVKLLVEYVGGAIAFQSEEGAGSIFIVTLPLEGMPERGITPHSSNTD